LLNIPQKHYFENLVKLFPVLKGSQFDGVHLQQLILINLDYKIPKVTFTFQSDFNFIDNFFEDKDKLALKFGAQWLFGIQNDDSVQN
jgi:hypothetical protein